MVRAKYSDFGIVGRQVRLGDPFADWFLLLPPPAQQHSWSGSQFFYRGCGAHVAKTELEGGNGSSHIN